MRRKQSLNHHIQPLDSVLLNKIQHILANFLNSQGTSSTLSFLIEKIDLVQRLQCEMEKTCKEKHHDQSQENILALDGGFQFAKSGGRRHAGKRLKVILCCSVFSFFRCRIHPAWMKHIQNKDLKPFNKLPIRNGRFYSVT